MAFVQPGTSNTLLNNSLPGLGGGGSNSQPINWGAISTTPKTTALNNAMRGAVANPAPSVAKLPTYFGNPSSGFSSPLLGTPSTLPTPQITNSNPLGGSIIPTNSLGGSFFNAGSKTPVGQNVNTYQPPQQSSGSIVPQGGNATPSQPKYPTYTDPQGNVYDSSTGQIIAHSYTPNSSIGTPHGPNANPPDWYTQAMNQIQPSLNSQGSTMQTQPGFQSTPSPGQTTLAQDEAKAQNQGQPGYDIFGNLLTSASGGQAPPPNTPAGYAQSLATNSQAGSPAAAIGASGLLSTTNSPLVSGLLSDYQQKAATAQQLQQQIAQAEQDVTKEPGITMATVGGEQGAIERDYGVQEQALAAQASNALNALQQGISEQGAQQAGFNEAGSLGLTGQGLLQSGLTSASQLTQPSALYTQVSPGNYLADTSGQGVAGGMSQGLANLTTLGQAQQNIAGGQALQGQAQVLAPVLQQLRGTGSQVAGLLQQSGLNPTSVPIANQLASPYFKQQNPAAAASVQKGLADISSYIGQILSTNSGLTPTEVTSLTDTNALESLSPQQLQVLLQNVDQLGQTRLQALQQGSQANYGANYSNSGAYAGPTANPGALSNAGATNSPLVSGVATAGSGVVGVLSSFAKQLGSFISENAALGIGAALFGG